MCLGLLLMLLLLMMSTEELCVCTSASPRVVTPPYSPIILSHQSLPITHPPTSSGKYRRHDSCDPDLSWQLFNLPLKASLCQDWYSACKDDYIPSCGSQGGVPCNASASLFAGSALSVGMINATNATCSRTFGDIFGRFGNPAQTFCNQVRAFLGQWCLLPCHLSCACGLGGVWCVLVCMLVCFRMRIPTLPPSLRSPRPFAPHSSTKTHSCTSPLSKMALSLTFLWVTPTPTIVPMPT